MSFDFSFESKNKICVKQETFIHALWALIFLLSLKIKYVSNLFWLHYQRSHVPFACIYTTNLILKKIKNSKTLKYCTHFLKRVGSEFFQEFFTVEEEFISLIFPRTSFTFVKVISKASLVFGYYFHQCSIQSWMMGYETLKIVLIRFFFFLNTKKLSLFLN